jgi:hypothetical protein
MKSFLLIVSVLLSSTLLIGQSNIKAFYIGHSLSDQIPDMVKSLADDHPDVGFDWAYQSIPGAPLRWQWQRKDANDYEGNPPYYYAFYNQEGGLPSGGFDIMVLTEAVPRHWSEWGIFETYQYADSFFVYANTYNPNIKVYLYEDWHCILSGTPTGCDYDIDSNPWRQRIDDDLPMWESVVDTLNARFSPTNPVCLIPATQGLAHVYDSIYAGVMPGLSDINDLFSDNIHLNDVGKYFVACVHFSTIFGTSPIGLTNQLKVWWGGNFEAPTPELALKFQQIAWEVSNTYTQSSLAIVDQIFDQFSDECFGAKQNIVLAGNGSIVEFEGGSKVDLIAGNSIKLLPGTYVQEGANVHAYISSDGSFCNIVNSSNQITKPIATKSLEIRNQKQYSVNDVEQQNIKVYPNPNKGIFTVKVEGLDQAAQIVIYNLLGSKVHQDIINAEKTIDISEIQRGLYFIKTINSKELLFQKIFIK